MATITRAQIRARARLHADFPNADQGKLDTELNLLIDDACAEYYDQLVAIRGPGYFEASDTISIISGTQSYDLPEDFYQLRTVVLEWGNDEHEPMRALSERETTTFANLGQWQQWADKGYVVRGTQLGANTIAFYPSPRTAVTARVRYVPTYTAFTADSGAGGTIDCANAWWKLIAIVVAKEFRGLLGLPTGHLEALEMKQIQRVNEMATERLQDEPARILDVSPETSNSWFPRRRWFRS